MTFAPPTATPTPALHTSTHIHPSTQLPPPPPAVYLICPHIRTTSVSLPTRLCLLSTQQDRCVATHSTLKARPRYSIRVQMQTFCSATSCVYRRYVWFLKQSHFPLCARARARARTRARAVCRYQCTPSRTRCMASSRPLAHSLPTQPWTETARSLGDVMHTPSPFWRNAPTVAHLTQ